MWQKKYVGRQEKMTWNKKKKLHENQGPGT